MSTIIEPLECPVDDVASVPRRFGVGVLMILMTAFAVLFAIMRTCGAPPEVFIVIAVLFFAVTVAQILLFQGKKPRTASVLSGAVAFPLVVAAVSIASETNGPAGGLVCMLAGSLFLTVPGGAALGYLAGCAMASVFFVQEKFRQRNILPVEIQLLPLTETDFDTLIAWVRHRPLFELWSQGQFHYPLDYEQLQSRYAPAAAETAVAVADENALSQSPPQPASPDNSDAWPSRPFRARCSRWSPWWNWPVSTASARGRTSNWRSSIPRGTTAAR